MNPDYFYFISGLPNISFEDSKLSYSTEQFRAEAKAQLSDRDFRYLEILHLTADLDNLLHRLYRTGRAINPEGLFPLEYWETYLAFISNRLENPNLATPAEFATLPAFISPILDKAMVLEELPPFLQTESELLGAFYKWTNEHPNSFIKQWFGYDAHLRNILAAINGRKFDLPYAQYLIGDEDFVEKLAKSHAADFGLGKEDALFESVVRIYEQNNILYRERSYDILRWKWIDDQNFFNYFNIDRVLGYYSKLRILSRWLMADPNVGKEVFHDTLNAMENSFTFPEEFNIKSVIK
ncbi:MAG: DUF2764 family protein [Candidatus Cloacimonas sp.]|jgi:hypothetical protein|nr:DUF2764 family protein [Candidatus Cloacimonas sp.]